MTLFAVHLAFYPDKRASAVRQNCCGELKNQWGWGGFNTKDMARSQTMARLVALVYNWWSKFVGLVKPDKHAEAITSRRQFLHGVRRVTKSGRQTTPKVTSTHKKPRKLKGARAGQAAY